MSTPRKHWFRVADSILYEGWDDNQIATMIRLGAYLNTRWAREGRTADEACRATLDPADLAKISGKRRRDVALKSLQRLADVTGMSVKSRGEVVEIIWPKWSIFQELKTPSKPEGRPQTSPSAPAPARRPRKTQKRESSDAPRPPARPSGVKAEKPESFDGEVREEIEAWAKRKGFSPAILNAGLERFREWEPLKQSHRTPKQWAAAFKRIVREGVEAGAIVVDPQRKPRGQAYQDADEMLRRRREEFEQESRGAAEDPESVGKIIDLALTGKAS